METLTKRQAEMLAFITAYADEHGYPPTVAEIMRRFSFSSPNAVTCHLQSLTRKGFLHRQPRISRGAVPADRPRIRRVPILGRVPAGHPVPEEEVADGFLSLDASFAGEGDIFALRVKGSSMEGAGIFDGDHVIVRKGIQPRSGDIVVAFLDGEYTVKRFFLRKDGVELRPEHDAFPVIRARKAAVVGKVIGLYRRLG